MISSSEVAYFSLTPNDISDLEQESSSASQRILALQNKPRELLATILISNNFINIGIVLMSDFILRGVISAEFCTSLANRLHNFLSFATVSTLANAIHYSITVISATFLLVLFGEVMPKVYAKINNVALAKNMSGIMTKLMSFFRPMSSLLVNATNVIESRFTSRTKNGNLTSREDIDEAIELTVKDQKHAKEDRDILKGIVKFGDVSVKQIMKSRVDVVTVEYETSYKELLDVIRESGYSRIPVHAEDFDHVKGILYVKDLLGYLQEGDDFNWQHLIHDNVFYVPESKKIDDLLREFQAERLHIAIVVDEFGGSSGIATLEDIMEEIIGEIRDEFDDTEIEFTKLDEYNYVFEGKTLLNDVCRIIGVDTTTFDEVKGDADSIAGLILEIHGQIPKAGREIYHEPYSFKIEAVNKRRIEQIKITLPKDQLIAE